MKKKNTALIITVAAASAAVGAATALALIYKNKKEKGEDCKVCKFIDNAKDFVTLKVNDIKNLSIFKRGCASDECSEIIFEVGDTDDVEVCCACADTEVVVEDTAADDVVVETLTPPSEEPVKPARRGRKKKTVVEETVENTEE